MSRQIAIIGGGISGITSAIKLAQNKPNEIHIYEKRNYILNGPPYCHLHAGGILYPEISLEDAQQLLYDSILFADTFKDCLEFRPTIVAYRSESKYTPNELLFKCKVNKINYQFSHKQPFGQVENFYAVYTKEDMIFFKKHGKLPESDDFGRKYHDRYVEYFCKFLDTVESIKYPFVSVCEPGINQEKVELYLKSQLKSYNNIKIFLNKEVNLNDVIHYDNIINASGYNMFNTNKETYEFKSSWIISSSLTVDNLPEIAIIGERDTDSGMIQITPIKKGLFQVHCMKSDSTIIQTSNNKIVAKLTTEEIETRGNVAIRELIKCFSILIMSKVIKACYGVQRIPYNNKSKRISYVIKKGKHIDLCTLKACSVISLSNKLYKLI